MAGEGRCNQKLAGELEGENQRSLLCPFLGFKTCVLTNNWVDDSAGRLFTATLMNLLHRHFDLVIESCRLGAWKPDPQIYTYALDALRAKPQEVRPSPPKHRDQRGPSGHPKSSGCPSPGR